MKYAKIENGTVVQTQPKKASGFIRVDDSVTCGMLYDGEIFTNPHVTSETLELNERKWRDSELTRSDIEIFKTEDTVGIFDAETWRSYRLLLRAWPTSPDFPDPTKRPIAPDAT